MKNTPHEFGRLKNSRSTKKLFNSLFAGFLGSLILVSCSQEEIEVPSTDSVDGPQLVTLAPRPDEIIEIQDLVPLELKATDAAGDDRGRFNIDIRYIVPPTDAQRAVFDEAVARWESIIIQDVPSITGTIPSAFVGVPPIIDGGTIDDIVIEAAIAPIDGPGNILGFAGPNFVRSADFLTVTGFMFFDEDDLAFLDILGLFEEVIVHEMGHVLGFGTLWNTEPDFPRTLLQGTLSSPYFAGQKANVFWNAEGGTGELPIESMGGPGTAFGHWQESTLDNELMTGFLDLGENPLSRITAGSMRDLGYGSASVGESYDLPRGTPGVDPDASPMEGPGLFIADMEVLSGPIGIVTTKKK